MEQNLLSNRPLIYEKDGYIGISTIDGSPILLPNQYVMLCMPNGLMPHGCPVFCEGLVPVSYPDGITGYIDEKGTVALPFIYEYAYSFIDGYAVARSNGKWGMIDRTGHEIVPFAYDMIFYEGLCADDRLGVVRNGKFGYIALDGTEAIPCIFDLPIGRCSGEFREGVSPVLYNGEVFFINPAGERVITTCGRFDYVASFEQEHAMVIQYKEDHRIYHGYLDRNGSLAVPVQYQQIGCRISEGVVGVLFNGRIVYTDMTGHIALKTPYDAVTEFHSHVAWGHKNGYWESFDREGNVLTTNFHFDRVIPCDGGHWIVWSGEECRCVDSYGKELLKPRVVPLCPYLNLGESDWVLHCLRS